MLPKKLLSIYIIIFTFPLSLPSVGQVTSSSENVTTNLNSQYKTLVNESETYNEYKVIKKKVLADFWKVVSDSVNQARSVQKEAFMTIREKQAQIDELNKTIVIKDEELISGEKEKSTLNVLGINFNKSSYAIVSTSLFLIFLAVIALMFFKLKSNNTITTNAVKNLSLVEEDYEKYKKRALEIQMKLKRDLQTERNKLAEIGR